jgi:hypothetical protein
VLRGKLSGLKPRLLLPPQFVPEANDEENHPERVGDENTARVPAAVNEDAPGDFRGPPMITQIVAPVLHFPVEGVAADLSVSTPKATKFRMQITNSARQILRPRVTFESVTGAHSARKAKIMR